MRWTFTHPLDVRVLRLDVVRQLLGDRRDLDHQLPAGEPKGSPPRVVSEVRVDALLGEPSGYVDHVDKVGEPPREPVIVVGHSGTASARACSTTAPVARPETMSTDSPVTVSL
ncbi:MAG: hypothetical protein ACOYBY_17440 [Dermatophilaceae bacterium]